MPTATTTESKSTTIYSIVLAALVCALLLSIHLGQPDRSSMWLNIFFDTLHVPVFALLGVCVFLLVEHRYRTRPWRTALLAGGAAFVLGLLSEAAQIPGPRDASVQDLAADMLGAGSALCFMLGLKLSSSRLVVRLLLLVLGIAVFAYALQPLASITAAYIERDRQFPTLLTFTGENNHRFVRAQNGQLTYTWSSEYDRTVASLRIRNAPYPALILHDLSSDWTAYDELVIVVGVSGDSDLTLNVRVHDDAHIARGQDYVDRFNWSTSIRGMRNVIRLPLEDIRQGPADRAMNLSQIDSVILFVSADDAGRQLYLAGMYLE